MHGTYMFDNNIKDDISEFLSKKEKNNWKIIVINKGLNQGSI